MPRLDRERHLVDDIGPDAMRLLSLVNSIDQATTIATNSIASLGKVSTADITGMQRMAASAGLESTTRKSREVG